MWLMSTLCRAWNKEKLGCTLATNFRQNVKTIRNLCNSEIDPKLYHIYRITFSSASWTCSKFTTTKNFLIIIAKPKSFCNYISGNLEALLSMVLSMICVYLFVQCLHCSGTEGYWRDARRCPKTLLGTCVHYVQLPVISEERSSTQRCNSVYYQQAVVSVNRKKKRIRQSTTYTQRISCISQKVFASWRSPHTNGI